MYKDKGDNPRLLYNTDRSAIIEGYYHVSSTIQGYHHVSSGWHIKEADGESSVLKDHEDVINYTHREYRVLACYQL